MTFNCGCRFMKTTKSVCYLRQCFDESFFIYCNWDVNNDLKCVIKTQTDCSRYKCHIKCKENEEEILSLMSYGSNPPLNEWTTIKCSNREIDENLKLEIIISNAVDKNTNLISSLFGKNFENTITCPVCFEIMCKEIYLCSNGHSICDECKETLDDCPKCRNCWTNTRNRDLESIISEIELPCKNNPCEFTGIPDQLKQHENVCRYKLFKCPKKKCKTENTLYEYESFLIHFRTHFGNEKQIFRDTLKKNTYYSFEYNKSLFKIRYRSDSTISIDHLMPTYDFKKYKCILTIFHPNNGVDKLQYIQNVEHGKESDPFPVNEIFEKEIKCHVKIIEI